MKKIYISLLTAVLFCFCSNPFKANTYFYQSGVGAITLPAAWNSLANGTGTVPVSFAGTHTYNIHTAGSVILSASWSVTAGSTVNFGDGTNALNFTMASGAILGASFGQTAPKIVVANACTLILNSLTTNWNLSNTKTVFNTGSTVNYGTGSDAPRGFAIPYYNLILSTPINLTGSSFNVANDFTINSTLDMANTTVSVTANVILNANVTLDGGSLIIGGVLSGSGVFIGDNNGGTSITLNGTGNVGTLNFQAGSRMLTNLILNITSGSVTLGSDLSIDGSNGGNLTLTSGALDLNGHTLSIDNLAGADLSGGTISGSSASSLLFTNVGTTTGSLMMGASNTLKVLYYNGISQMLTLGNTLNITDSIAVKNGVVASGGNLTLKSTSALKGRVGMMGPTGSISGNVTVETFAPGPDVGWALLGVNVDNQTIGSWDGQFPITCIGCTYEPEDVGYFYSVQGYNEADPTAYCYDTLVTSATPLVPGTGYWVYLGASSAGAGDITFTHSGNLTQGQVSHPITYSGIIGDSNIDGFNLVANPYASPISLDILANFNSQSNDWQEGGVHVWNANGGGSDVFLQTGLGLIIPSGQGFFVHASSFGGSPVTYPLVFDESMKTADNDISNQLQKSAQQTADISGFKLTVAGINGDKDKTDFRFKQGATTGFDRRYDGYKRFVSPGYMGTGSVYSQYTSISSKLQNDYYTFNTLPVLSNSLSVPVLVKVATTGNYTISATDVQNYDGCTIIKDKLTGHYHDLSTGPYVCTINDTTSTPRFELVLCKMTTETSVKELNAAVGNVQVAQDEDGIYVNTFFTQNTKATISVYNIVGQQLIKDLNVEGTETKTRLNVDSHNEVLLIKINTDTETVTKKIITR